MRQSSVKADDHCVSLPQQHVNNNTELKKAIFISKNSLPLLGPVCSGGTAKRFLYSSMIVNNDTKWQLLKDPASFQEKIAGT